MKTPISYYGGKQNLVPAILPLLSEPHARYVEAFVGGGAVFWAKRPSPLESINDLDERVTTFYEVCQTRFDELNERIQATLHSESVYRLTGSILKAGKADPVEFAWAFWVQTNMSFAKKIYGGFAFSGVIDRDHAFTTHEKKRQFTDLLSSRLARVEVFSRDALSIIDLKDARDTLFYLDPPYVSSDCGHYKGYTKQDFETLLHRLIKLEGKFVLSSYPEGELLEAITQAGWFLNSVEQIVAVSGKRKGKLMKTECMTTNFRPITERQQLIFQ